MTRSHLSSAIDGEDEPLQFILTYHQRAALPNTLYTGSRSQCRMYFGLFSVTTRPLAKALSALAAEVIQARMSAKYGLRVGVIAILHTFNGELKFNSHVHTMVTGGWFTGVLPHLGFSLLLRSRPTDEVLAEGRDRASPRSAAGGSAWDGVDR